jgi:hypothetical protein
VQEALEELRSVTNQYGVGIYSNPDVKPSFTILLDRAKNLVDALEESPLTYSNQQETPVSSIVEHTSKSISELDELFALLHHQSFSCELIAYLEFILHHQESLEKRIERLEQLTKQ